MLKNLINNFLKCSLQKKNVIFSEIIFKNNLIFFFRFVNKHIFIFFYQNISLKLSQIVFTKKLNCISLNFRSFWQIQGLNSALITTSRGLVTDLEIKKQKKGGYVFCFFI